MSKIANLPVPEIIEDTVFQHSFTQKPKKEEQNLLKPPKLRTRLHHDLNWFRNLSSSQEVTTHAHIVSFRDESSSQLSKTYDETLNESYFEQCFETVTKLGEGSFGQVFKVRWKEDDLFYAVKMSKQFYRSEQNRQERLEEVRRYEQFSGHANCLRFYQAWEEDDRLYMQMELCRESLEHYAERSFPKKIPEKKIWSILLDLLLALKSLHDRNLIHLDIKLDNVLIGDDDSCKLADFGLVIDVDRANRDQATEGDSRYMAPEIMQGNFSKAADIFSLGIAMLELSCYLKLPSNGPLWQQLRSGQLPQDFVKTISPELCAVIEQMMTPDPLERPSVDSLLSHEKLVLMLKQRQHWDLVRIIHQTWRQTISSARTLVHSIKGMLYDFLSSLQYKMMIKPQISIPIMQCTPKQAPAYSSTPAQITSKHRIKISNDYSPVQDTNSRMSYRSTPIGNIDLTPINSHHNFRSRKDLTKTSFRRKDSPDLDSSSDFSSRLMCISDIEMSVLSKRLFDDDIVEEYK